VNTIDENLKYLKLSHIAEIYEEEAEIAAKKNLTHIQYLEKLLQQEVNSKIERAIKRRIKQADFPTMKTIDTFDFNWPKSINKQLVLKLMDLDFIKKKSNAVILGAPGLGKSHISQAIGYKACCSGISTKFATALDIVNDLNAAISDNTFAQKLRSYAKVPLLVIDELGFLPIDKKGADLLFQVISKRYEQGSIVLTTNRAFKHWGKIFNNDNTLASAIIERLCHHCEIVKIEGESYRLKDKKKKKLVSG